MSGDSYSPPEAPILHSTFTFILTVLVIAFCAVRAAIIARLYLREILFAVFVVLCIIAYLLTGAVVWHYYSV